MGAADRRRDAGAGKPGTSLIGDDLADFLRSAAVTALCLRADPAGDASSRTCPTLRSPASRGEACPHHLVVRWHRPGRTILNAYGPTEATVTATLTELVPDKPVTIGGPLPTYTIVILDENKDAARRATASSARSASPASGWPRGYLNRDGPDAARSSSPTFSDIAEQSFEAHLPHRRPRPHQRGRRGRIPRPHRHAGQNPRLPHRAGRDRVGAAAVAADRAGGRRPPTSRSRARWSSWPTTRCKQGAAELRAERDRADAAQPAAGLHGAGLLEQLAGHPDDDRATRPIARICRARRGRASRVGSSEYRRPAQRTRGGARRRAGRGDEGRAGLDRGQFLPRPRRPFAADGALLRRDPQAPGHVGRLHAGHLSATRRSRSSPRISIRCELRLERKCPPQRAASRSAFRPISNITAAARCSSLSYVVYWPVALWLVDVGFSWTYAAIDSPARALSAQSWLSPSRSSSFSPPFPSRRSGC